MSNRCYQRKKRSFAFVFPSCVMLPPITEHALLHSKSLSKNMARASVGYKYYAPTKRAGGHKRKRSKKRLYASMLLLYTQQMTFNSDFFFVKSKVRDFGDSLLLMHVFTFNHTEIGENGLNFYSKVGIGLNGFDR